METKEIISVVKFGLYLVLFGVLLFPLARSAKLADESLQQGGIPGTVVYVDLEGGFYGIVDNSGKHYDPIDLPQGFRKDGMKVRFWPETCPDCVSFRMWGQIVRLKKIERAS